MRTVIKTVAAVALVAATLGSMGAGGWALAREWSSSHFKDYHAGNHFWCDRGRSRGATLHFARPAA